MTIYTTFYAPIEITAAHNLGGGLYLIKANRTGPYQDGSGATGLPVALHAEDRVAKGWFPNTGLRADDGIREINEACRNAPQEKPANLKKIIKYYGLRLIDDEEAA